MLKIPLAKDWRDLRIFSNETLMTVVTALLDVEMHELVLVLPDILTGITQAF